MQPYPQLPAQNMTPQRPWWLIFGFSFGAGVILIFINVIRLLVISALLRSALPFALLDDQIFSILFYLLDLSACLVAGILVAGKTRRAGSATLASLLIELLFSSATSIPVSLWASVFLSHLLS